MSDRIPKVNQLVKKELSRIIFKEVDFPEGILVTLTRVESSANLIQAKVYVSVIPEEKLRDVLIILGKSVYSLQHKLNERLRMRPIPKIMFIEEKATIEAGRVEELLEKIRAKNSKVKNQSSK